MHEARHIDGFPHIMCTHGARANMQGACDKRITDEGSYAVTVETYAQLSRYAEDLHPALRAYAAVSAVTYADEAFEVTTKVEREVQFLLTTTAGEFYTLDSDGSAKLERRGKSPALGRIVPRGRLSILFPDDRKLPAKFVFFNNEGDIQQSAHDLAAEYNAQTPAQRADLVGLHLAAQWNVRVYHNHLLFNCDPRSAATEGLPLHGQVAASILYPDGYDRATYSAVLATESGALLDFGCNASKAFVSPSTLTFDQKYTRVLKVSNMVVGLTGDGRLFTISGSRSAPLQTSLDGRVFDVAPTERVDFFEPQTPVIF